MVLVKRSSEGPHQHPSTTTPCLLSLRPSIQHTRAYAVTEYAARSAFILHGEELSRGVYAGTWRRHQVQSGLGRVSEPPLPAKPTDQTPATLVCAEEDQHGRHDSHPRSTCGIMSSPPSNIGILLSRYQTRSRHRPPSIAVFDASASVCRDLDTVPIFPGKAS